MQIFDENRCLEVDPLWEKTPGEKRLADKFVTTRVEHKCDICAGGIEKKEKVRAISEQYGEKKIRSFYFCNECCYAMAEFWSDGGKKWDARVALKADKKK